MSGRRTLVTGAHGCIGAWIVHELVTSGEDVVTFDLSTDPRRLALILDPEQLAGVTHVAGDITDLSTVEAAIDEHEITNLIHLAALQIPLCRANPVLGARVNVVGTVNVFEAVRRREGRIGPVAYASSIAVYDAPDGEPLPTMTAHPGTLYGAYKRTNESTAWIYAVENGIPSVGLRPHTVYGVGRDQGLTAAPTSAMLAAAAGTSFTIPYGGPAQLQFASDVARAFIEASRSESRDATVHNLPGPVTTIPDVIGAIADVSPSSRGEIQFDDVPLPFPAATDSSSFARAFPGFVLTPITDGVRSTIERFSDLLARGILSIPAN